jgi:endonuclease YncB( thermonuclease family)
VSSLVAGAGLHYGFSERHLPTTQGWSAVEATPAAATGWTSIDICRGGNRKARRATCIVDGDTGWENGVKWRLYSVDTPELSSPACSNERRTGIAARDRIRDLMSGGYRMEWIGSSGTYGRKLVRIRLANGRYAGQVLIQEGLAQPWPNSGNVWCNY